MYRNRNQDDFAINRCQEDVQEQYINEEEEDEEEEEEDEDETTKIIPPDGNYFIICFISRRLVAFCLFSDCVYDSVYVFRTKCHSSHSVGFFC